MFRRRRRLVCVLVFVFCATLYPLLQLIRTNLSDRSSSQNSDFLCDYGRMHRRKLLSMTKSVNHLLSTHNVTHFLCYGSLWGALRRSEPLPWSHDVKFCALNEELSKIDEGFLKRIFKSRGLSIQYNSFEGVYRIAEDPMVNPGASTKLSPSAHTPEIQLTLFELSPDGQFHRIGIHYRVLPPGSIDLQEFPSTLLQKRPLSQVQFGELSLPIPNEGIELQKYHYANDWWIERVPKKCSDAL